MLKKENLVNNKMTIILVSLAVSLFVGVSYFLMIDNYTIRMIDSGSLVYLDLIFIFVGGLLIYAITQNKVDNKEVKLIKLGLTGLGILLIALSLLEKDYINQNEILYPIVRTLLFFIETLFAYMGVAGLIKFYFSNLHTNESNLYLTHKELNNVVFMLVTYVVITVIIPTMMIQMNENPEKILHLIGQLLASSVLAFTTYRHIKKKYLINQDEKLTEYRYLAMRRDVLPNFINNFKKEVTSIEKINVGLSEHINGLGVKRNDFVALSEQIPSFKKRISEIKKELSKFNVDALNREKENELKSIEDTKKQIWKDNFEERFETGKTEIAETEEKISTLEAAEVKMQETFAAKSQTLVELEAEFTEKNNAQEAKKSSFSKYNAEKYELRKTLETTTDKEEIKSIEAKIEKAVRNEAILDYEICEFENALVSLKEQVEMLQSEVSELRDEELPKLHNIKTVLKEKLDALQIDFQAIDGEYEQAIAADEVIIKANKILSDIATDFSTIEDLEKESAELEAKVAIDTQMEIAAIDAEITVNEDKISENNMEIESFQNREQSVRDKITRNEIAIHNLEKEFSMQENEIEKKAAVQPTKQTTNNAIPISKASESVSREVEKPFVMNQTNNTATEQAKENVVKKEELVTTAENFINLSEGGTGSIAKPDEKASDESKVNLDSTLTNSTTAEFYFELEKTSKEPSLVTTAENFIDLEIKVPTVNEKDTTDESTTTKRAHEVSREEIMGKTADDLMSEFGKYLNLTEGTSDKVAVSDLKNSKKTSPSNKATNKTTSKKINTSGNEKKEKASKSATNKKTNKQSKSKVVTQGTSSTK